jgi:hypothetical protein
MLPEWTVAKLGRARTPGRPVYCGIGCDIDVCRSDSNRDSSRTPKTHRYLANERSAFGTESRLSSPDQENAMVPNERRLANSQLASQRFESALRLFVSP